MPPDGAAATALPWTSSSAAAHNDLVRNPVFQQMLEALPSAAYTCDRDGLITSYNAVAVALWGRAPRLRHPSDRYCGSFRLYGADSQPIDHAECWMARALRQDTAFNGQEIIVERPDGSRVWALAHANPLKDADGRTCGAINILLDITARREGAERERAERDRFRLMVEHVREYAMFMVDAEGLIVTWNTGASRMYGYEAGEIVGRAADCLLTQEDVAAGVHAEALAAASRQAGYTGEGWRVRKDGSLFWASIALTPLFDDTGRLRGYGQVTRDMNAWWKLEEQLRHTQNMKVIGQLAGGVAHDFNNILGVIVGSAELVLEDPGLREPSQEALARVLRSAHSAAALVDKLLAFSRPVKTGEQSSVVVDVAVTVAEILRRTLAARIHIALDVSGDCWSAAADPTDLQSALLNIAINARDAMPSGGTLTIRAGNRPGHDPSRDLVEIAVSDTGCGMDETTLSHAFEPFFTTKGPGTGTGLGLSTVKAFAEGLGGTVTIESRQSQGTTVRLRLPRTGGRRDTRRAREAPVPPLARPRRILVVEDNESVRATIQNVLVSLGFSVVTAPGPAEARAAFAGEPSIDILWVDHQLNDTETGVELARALKRQMPGLRVVISSGHLDVPTKPSADWHVLQKPVSRAAITAALGPAS
jgi:PAS domain S-box-containing protein